MVYLALNKLRPLNFIQLHSSTMQTINLSLINVKINAAGNLFVSYSEKKRQFIYTINNSITLLMKKYILG